MSDLPTLDCHAHISPDVTGQQLERLGNTIVLAMTREPTETMQARRRHDLSLLWGAGAHPAYVAGGGRVDIRQFGRAARSLGIAGEIGLDQRSGNLERQREVLEGLLDMLQGEPVLISMHSKGCEAEVLEMVQARSLGGVIMHWFSGQAEQVRELLSLGCYFSVNTAMRRDVLAAIPLKRVLPETDFPAAGRRTGQRPGDTSRLEQAISEMHGTDPSTVRRRFYRNLRRISVESGAIDKMPSPVVDILLEA